MNKVIKFSHNITKWSRFRRNHVMQFVNYCLVLLDYDICFFSFLIWLLLTTWMSYDLRIKSWSLSSRLVSKRLSPWFKIVYRTYRYEQKNLFCLLISTTWIIGTWSRKATGGLATASYLMRVPVASWLRGALREAPRWWATFREALHRAFFSFFFINSKL